MPATRLIIPVPATHDAWTLDEEDVPETALHELIIGVLLSVLRAWVDREKRNAMVGSNIALRWDREHPKRGVDPDVYLVEPAPPEGERLTSLCLWKKGHHAPRVAIEVVSEHTAEKDYGDGPARYGASGTRELWVFDPLRFGPERTALQLWRRTPKGGFKRVYAGDGPAFSRELGVWLVVTDGGTRLRIADDAAGTRLWPTREEHERAEKERERAEKERERAEKERERAEKERSERAREAVEAELARLRAQLAKRTQPAVGSTARPSRTRRRS